MDRELFVKRKENLVRLLKNRLADVSINSRDSELINRMLKILEECSFENRLEYKGLMAHIIVDAWDWHDPLGAKVIEFDHNLSQDS